MTYENPVTFTSEGKLLQGSVYLPDTQTNQPIPAVVICHPHPRAGGSMDNNVVFACCSGLRENSIAYLRFNFQGVGQSQGTAGDPDSHVADILSAAEYVAGMDAINPNAIGIAGYSFGGSTTIKALLNGLNPAAATLIGCSFPAVTPLDREKLNLPKLVILGENDSFIDAQSVSAIADTLDGKTEVTLIPGADHFFMGSEKVISTMVGDFFYTHLTKRPVNA